MVPTRIRCVTIAAAVRVTQASGPQTASQVKIASQPALLGRDREVGELPRRPRLITMPLRILLMLAPWHTTPTTAVVAACGSACGQPSGSTECRDQAGTGVSRPEFSSGEPARCAQIAVPAPLGWWAG